MGGLTFRVSVVFFCPQKEIAEVLIMRPDGDFQAFNYILIIYLENVGALYPPWPLIKYILYYKLSVL